MKTLHPRLQQLADQYPAFAVTSVRGRGMTELSAPTEPALLPRPTLVDLYGSELIGSKSLERGYNQSFVSAGIGEIVLAKTLLAQPAPERTEQVKLPDGQPAGALVYGTVLRDTSMQHLHTDAYGRPGNYLRIAQTMPASETAASLEAVADQPTQIRLLTRYILEARMGLESDRYYLPDYDALADQGVDSMALGYGTVPSPVDADIRPAS